MATEPNPSGYSLSEKQEVFYRDKARVLWADPSSDDIEVDDDAKLSETDNGVWVQAWVWVAKPLCEDCGEPYDESKGDPWAMCDKCIGGLEPEKEE